MECPHCSYPMLSSQVICPYCGKDIYEKKPPKDHKTDPSVPESAGEAAADSGKESGPSQGAVANPPIEGKIDLARFIILAPLASGLLFGLKQLFKGVSVMNSVLSPLFGISLLASIIALPAVFIMCILGLKKIKKNPDRYTGKRLAGILILVSVLLMVGIPGVSIMYLATEGRAGKLMQKGTVAMINKAIKDTEEENRASGSKNAAGSYFPAILDEADTLSFSGKDNPFFKNVIKPGGYVMQGWRKGTDSLMYILLIDSSVFRYDPAEGTFLKQDPVTTKNKE